MGKYSKKDQKKPGGKILIAVLILAVIAALAAAYVMFLHPNQEEGTPPEQTQAATEDGSAAIGETQPQTQTEPGDSGEPAMEYPLILEDGRMEISSLFHYQGMNPDCGYEEGHDVAAAMLVNTSEAYLEEAKITLTLTDGTVVNFIVHDLPAGKTVMAFDIANTSMEAEAMCADVSCEARWNDELVPVPEGIDLAVDGVAVTVTNHTGRDIPELVVYCRCPLDGEYFGGIAYQYTLNDLSANESATVEAWDCILGMAEVVRIAVNQE